MDASAEERRGAVSRGRAGGEPDDREVSTPISMLKGQDMQTGELMRNGNGHSRGAATLPGDDQDSGSPMPPTPVSGSGSGSASTASVAKGAGLGSEYRTRPYLIDSPVDLDRIRRAVREILAAVGEDPDREGLRDTPARVARMYAEVFQGLHQDPRDHLGTAFTESYGDTVLIRDISFISFCEHHLLPFTGRAHVAYRPNGRVVGLSKVPRVVDVVSRRPQLQERLTTDVADLLYHELNAKGVAVFVEATHSCMTIRGVSKPGSSCWTVAMRGEFENDPAARAEVLSMVRS